MRSSFSSLLTSRIELSAVVVLTGCSPAGTVSPAVDQGGVSGTGGAATITTGGSLGATGGAGAASGASSNATFGGNSVTSGGQDTGGAISTGGAFATGGREATGGAVATGGSKANIGGSPTGGSKSTGGAAPTGGAMPTGGAKATGGAAATGGNKSTGGAVATGGASSNNAPTWSQLFTNYFAKGTAGDCITCHGTNGVAHQFAAFNDATTMCTTLKNLGYIPGQLNVVLSTWFGGNGLGMPQNSNPTPANAVADITAWQNAGSVCP